MKMCVLITHISNYTHFFLEKRVSDNMKTSPKKHLLIFGTRICPKHCDEDDCNGDNCDEDNCNKDNCNKDNCDGDGLNRTESSKFDEIMVPYWNDFILRHDINEATLPDKDVVLAEEQTHKLIWDKKYKIAKLGVHLVDEIESMSGFKCCKVVYCYE